MDFMKITMRRIWQGLLLAILCCGFGAAFADGTETLGPPSVPIGQGTGIVAAGVGLENVSSGAIDIDIPGDIIQVFVYWAGAVTSNNPADDTILIDGTAVTGVRIGGPAYFFSAFGKDFFYSNYRADITGLGLVGPGPNSLTVEGLNNKDADGNGENSGAGLLVIYDDGSDLVDIQLRDGLDLAWVNFPDPRQTTIPQSFTFPPTDSDRVAGLEIFAGSVGESDRPNTIRLTTDGPSGTTTDLFDRLVGVDGPLWDTLSLPIDIPAGTSMLTVQILSEDALGTGLVPASLNWVGAGLSVEPEEMQGGDGCTPGYWKQPHHFDSWVAYSPTDSYEAVFGVDASFDKTLLGALKQGGGGEKALGRHAVAALLNAANPDVSYAFSEADVVALVRYAYDNDQFEMVKNELAYENELGCPLN